MKNTENDLRVLVYYCECGKSIQCASSPDFAKADKATKKEYGEMASIGRKIETITLEDFKGKPFYCNGVDDCHKKR